MVIITNNSDIIIITNKNNINRMILLVNYIEN